MRHPEYTKGWDAAMKAANGEHPRVNIPVSRIRCTWLRRLAICCTVPLGLLYCLIWVPIVVCINALVRIVVLPPSFFGTVLTTARKQW